VKTMRSETPAQDTPSVWLMGLRVDPISDSDVVHLVSKAIRSHKNCIIANHNLHSIYLWYHERRMRQFYDGAEYVHIDGMFLILLANMLGVPLKRENRATSLDFFPILAPLAVKENWRIFYLGSKPGVAARAAAKLEAKYPGLQIRTRHGHFDANLLAKQNREVVEEINAYAPHVLLVGMGMPRQEIWIMENQKDLTANVVFPAGAFMDYMAGEIPTAPRWLASIYLEWMYRLFTEPTRLWRRYLVEPWFVAGQIARYYTGFGRQYVAPQDTHND
jgi:N-acetylglucosaminyldiphosphoundecaprenol N-acetyl-beta-D-mannosaminyltransferase